MSLVGAVQRKRDGYKSGAEENGGIMANHVGQVGLVCGDIIVGI
jgi:hypothetical protein